ncbi:WD40 repeat domain-containing protein [Solirubrobacter phytolaccae]|uniref:WD40 repeat domain-containing protein n=2 Tax=Solirubrobacter phytolaccae TaxID=1404360 RepID=A0A9X3NBH4_9ACTN|nr:WD40 repeat domain-containing protein [Solirubrobacter phytolaccae]MDA0181702.1 WD40 repeat domain-containing protein [Solirubrobacter phytolaccae]
MSEGGHVVLTGSFDRTVAVWKTGSVPSPVRRLRGHQAAVTAVACDSDGSELVSGGLDGRLLRWSSHSPDRHETLREHSRGVTALAMDRTSGDIAVGYDDGELHVQSRESHEWLQLGGSRQRVVGVSVSRAQDSLLAIRADGTIQMWELSSGALLSATAHHSPLTAAAVEWVGGLVVVGDTNYRLSVYELRRPRPAGELVGHSGWITAIGVQGGHAISAATDGTIRSWDLRTTATRSVVRPSAPVGALAVDREGRVAAGTDEGDVVLTTIREDAAAARTGWRRPVHHAAPVWAVKAVSGDVVATGSADFSVGIWAAQDARPLRVLEGHTAWVNAVAGFAAGTRVLSGSSDSTLRVWDIGSGALLGTLHGHDGWINAVAVSPDGEIAISGASDQVASVWTLEPRRRLITLVGHSAAVTGVALSKSKAVAATCSADGTVRLWRTADGAALRVIGCAHETLTPFTSVHFVSDSGALVASSLDGRIWTTDEDCVSLRLLAQVPGRVWGLAVLADGRHVAVPSIDGRLRVLSADSGAQIASCDLGTPLTACATVPGASHLVVADRHGGLHISPTPSTPELSPSAKAD